MSHANNKLPTCLLAVLICGLSVVAAGAQSTLSGAEGPPTDTVFIRILLNEEGVIAYDSAGQEWRYDFQQGTFVAGGADASRRSDRRGLLTGDDMPVEERCTQEKKVKAFERSVWVGYDEYVDGDIVAYGRVTIKGWVKGDVKSIGKRVLVTESGRVDGDVEAPSVILKDGAEVLGEVKVVGTPLELDDFTRSFSPSGLIVVMSFAIAFLVFGFLTATLMPRQVRNMDGCLSHKTVRSVLLGFLLVLFLPAILVVVTITIVGIIVLPFLPLLYVVAIGLGVVAFGNILGRFFCQRYLGGEKNILLQSTIGILLLMSLWFAVALLLGSDADVSYGLGIFLLLVSILFTCLPILGGVGAALLTRFGFREYQRERHDRRWPGASEAPAPAPPPLPEGPQAHGPVRGIVPSDATPLTSPRIPERDQ
ncbi:MAG TPA: polymer-forming cytoskeletal protein [Candidatus Deferrimicrobium sp.]|nr:polymer-forming cytoskeletal protein [Candidatus Deferrimicrobium sp.]